MPVTPIRAVDPQLQQTVELLTHALSRGGRTKDLAMTLADLARKIGAVDFDMSGDPAVAEDWIENMEKILEVIEVPQERKVVLATFFLRKSAYTGGNK